VEWSGGKRDRNAASKLHTSRGFTVACSRHRLGFEQRQTCRRKSGERLLSLTWNFLTLAWAFDSFDSHETQDPTKKFARYVGVWVRIRPGRYEAKPFLGGLMPCTRCRGGRLGFWKPTAAGLRLVCD